VGGWVNEWMDGWLDGWVLHNTVIRCLDY